MNFFIQSLSIERCPVYRFWLQKVSKLDLESIYIEVSDVPSHRVYILFKELRKMKNLKFLKVMGLNILNRSAFSDELNFLNGITKLDISSNRLGYEGIKLLMNSVNEIKSLRELNVSNNYLGCKETLIVAESVMNMKNLEILNISVNAIGPLGVDHILNLMKVHTKLKSIDVSCNFLSKEKIHDILEEIKSNDIKINIII